VVCENRKEERGEGMGEVSMNIFGMEYELTHVGKIYKEQPIPLGPSSATTLLDPLPQPCSSYPKWKSRMK
jgi:hypothetical protein